MKFIKRAMNLIFRIGIKTVILIVIINLIFCGLHKSKIESFVSLLEVESIRDKIDNILINGKLIITNVYYSLNRIEFE